FSNSKGLLPAPGSLEDCPRCAKPIYSNVSRCSWCGLNLFGPTAQELADLEATARQLARFQERRLIDGNTLADLKNQVKARFQELGGLKLKNPPPKPIPKPKRKLAPTPALPIPPPSPAVPVLEAATVEDPQWVLNNEAPSVPSMSPQSQPQEAPIPFLD